jgi:dTDP-4-amino-4,6-dideoxygalactose transaminase
MFLIDVRFNQSNRSFHNEFGYKLKMSDLLQKFGVKELRDFQQESVDNLFEGKDAYLSDFYLRA